MLACLLASEGSLLIQLPALLSEKAFSGSFLSQTELRERAGGSGTRVPKAPLTVPLRYTNDQSAHFPHSPLHRNTRVPQGSHLRGLNTSSPPTPPPHETQPKAEAVLRGGGSSCARLIFAMGPPASSKKGRVVSRRWRRGVERASERGSCDG